MKKQKFVANIVEGHGEGSWARINIPFDVEKVFGKKGYVQVKGKIDDYQFDKIKLMPSANGKHWMPVNKKIRNAINKSNESVTVEIEFDPEEKIYQIPDDFSIELQKHPKASLYFNGLSKASQKWFIQSITEAKQAETRRKRIDKAIEKLVAGKKFHD